MRKINYYSLALLSALTVFGCSENDLFEASQNPNNAISFSTQAGKHSRATVLDNGNVNTNGTKFGLYAYYTGQKDWVSREIKDPNFMNDQEVTCNGTAWSYDPLKYWPNTKDDKISFFAYMPKGSAGDAKAEVKATDALSNEKLPKITFTQDVANADKMVDFVVAQKLDQMKQTEAVVLPFQHVLTRLNFAAKVDKDLTATTNGKSTTQVFVRGLRVLGTENSEGINKTTDASGENNDSRFFSEAIYQLNSSTDADKKNGTWDTESDTNNSHTNRVSKPLELTSTILNVIAADFNGYKTSSVALEQDASATQLLKGKEYLFLIPPYGKEGIKSEKDIRVQLDYDIVTKLTNDSDGKHSITSTSATISLPNGSLVEGKAYNIVFTIGLTDVNVKADVTPWPETENEVDASSVVASNNSNEDISAALGELYVIKGKNSNNNYFTINIPAASYDIDLSNWLAFDRSNFEKGDKIHFVCTASDGNSLCSIKNVPSGWTYNSEDRTLTLDEVKTDYKKTDYYQWDAFSYIENGYNENTELEENKRVWESGSEAYNSSMIALQTCKGCPTSDEMAIYVGNEPYWDENGPTYMLPNGYKYKKGVWLKKYDKCDKSKSLGIGNSYGYNEKYQSGITDEIRNSGDYFFLPALGVWQNNSVAGGGATGYYWSSSCYEENGEIITVVLYFSSKFISVSSTRCTKLSKRYLGMTPWKIK